jgi:hypothetical protein
MTYHPHINMTVNMTVPGGGISADGTTWVNGHGGLPIPGVRALENVPGAREWWHG